MNSLADKPDLATEQFGVDRPARMRKISVVIVEPVIPHYRVPLFEGLARMGRFDLRVIAGPSFPGAPESVSEAPSWASTDHRHVAFLGGHLFWQRGVSIPSELGPGDVLVLDSNPRFLRNPVLMWQARRQKVGIVMWGHGRSPTSLPWRAWLRFRYMDTADVVLVYTDEEVAELKSIKRWRAPLLATNNALDEEAIAKAADQWPKERLAHFVETMQLEGRKVLLFCGRLRLRPASTELEVAVRALTRLREMDDRYLLAIIGSGEAEGMLRRMSHELGVEHLVRWVGPVYGESALAPWFLVAQCFVYPGSIGLSLLHAFGYALPVVTHDSRTLHNPEISALVDGANGLLFRKGNSEDLAHKVHRLCSDVSLRQGMSERARETVKARFSMAGMIKRFSNAIVMASHRSLHRLVGEGDR